MRMSTKSRFAVNAMIDLALRHQAGPVALGGIGARQQVSLSSLEQVFSNLRQAGLVQSTRGPGGGYVLGRDAAQISVADIILAVDEAGDEAADSGPARSLWAELHTVMLQHMAGISLQTLLQEQLQRGAVLQAEPAAPAAATRRGISAQPVVKPLRSKAPNSVFAFGLSFAR